MWFKQDFTWFLSLNHNSTETGRNICLWSNNQTSWIPWSLTHNSMILSTRIDVFTTDVPAKKDQISTNVTFSWPGQLTFLTSRFSHIPNWNTPQFLFLNKEHPNSHKLHTKRQIIPVAVIKSNIYNIFYKIYQCIFYVIYKLAVLLESMVFWNLLMSNFPDHYCLISHAWWDYLEFRIV